MDLLCPHCLKRVAVPDERAGQALNCPLCAGSFIAPALTAPSAAVPTPPPVPPDAYKVGPPPSTPPPPGAAPKPAAPPPRPLRTGDHANSIGFVLRIDVLSWLPPLCLGLIFLLSFFDWHRSDNTSPWNLWQLAFGEAGSVLFLAYLLFTVFLATPLAAASLVLENRWLPLPPAVENVMPWKALVLAAPLGLTFFLLCVDYLHGNLTDWGNPIAPAEKFAFRLHFLALLACLLEFWLYFRKRWNAPLPRIEFRW